MWAVLALALTAPGARADGDGVTSELEGSAPERAPAGRHCLDEARARWLVRHTLVGQVGPLGAESDQRAGLCLPLVRDSGALFTSSRLELGVTSQLAPGYVTGGPYLVVVPIAFFVLRSELLAVHYFRFPFEGAGYFPVSGPAADLRPAAYPAKDAGSASGLSAVVTAVLRAELDVGPAAAVRALAAIGAEYFGLGEGAHYLNLRREVITRRRDWIATVDAVLIADLALSEGARFIVGPFDAFRTVASSGYVANQAGVIVGARWPRPGALGAAARDLELVLRVGFHTEHAFRGGDPSVLLALSSAYDLGPL